jgi:hypothetical protein
MLWRERAIGLAKEAGLPLFARNVLTAFARLCVAINFHNVDAVVSCTALVNPTWELDLGGTADQPRHGRTCRMAFKLSPITNGMRQGSFTVVRAKELPTPTAMMLSHVNPLKDVVTAIKAAALLVKKYQLDYKLIVHGSLEQDPDYADECRMLIDTLGLASNVLLAGLGNSAQVLPQASVFLNSSVTEGLPLALGEAGLCGLPVAATDVGGSRQVICADLAHPRTTTYGAICPPADPEQLAVAQIKIFALLDELAPPVVPEPDPAGGLAAADEVKAHDASNASNVAPVSATTSSWAVYKRMFDQGGSAAQHARDELRQRIVDVRLQRQALGMRLRAYISTSFDFERYLREHRQSLAQAARITAQRSRGGSFQSAWTAEHSIVSQQPSLPPLTLVNIVSV